VVVLNKGINIFSGRVDELISSNGFFELKTSQQDELINLIDLHPNFSNTKIEGKLITVFLKLPMDAEEFNKLLFTNGIILSHLVKRKESLEEQFLQLTENK
jgi:ABC-2 type transport system ATP-binding protein